MSRLCINLLGKIEFKYDEKNLEHKLSNKGIALISILMLERKKRFSRDKLVSYLWADSDEEAARYNLRYNLWNIRKIIPADEAGNELIISNKDFCSINEDYDMESDMLQLMKFESSKAEKSLDELIAYKKLFRGDFLEGVYLKNCDEFNERIIFERILFHNKYVELLNAISDKYIDFSRFRECIDIVNEWAGIEPYNEKIIQKQIAVYTRMGKRSDAVNCYKKFEAALRSNLSISPSSDLKREYNELINKLHEKPEDEIEKEGIIKKQSIEVEVQCISGIDYFCISDIIRKLILKCDRRYIFGLCKCYLDDLNFIQLEIGLGYEKLYNDKCALFTTIPDVRILDAFVKFMKYASDVYTIKLTIANPADMDSISSNILNYIEKEQIKDIVIVR